jgi:hypothetical protein
MTTQYTYVGQAEAEKAQNEIGEKLIEVLQLKKKPNGRVDTTWGDKTPLGLYLTVQAVIEQTIAKQQESDK